MPNSPVEGILVDLKELEKTPNLVLWGRTVRSDGFIFPHVKLLEIPLARDIESIKENGLLSDIYFTFE